MKSSTHPILVATDFSEGSDEALTQGIALAKQTHAEIELVHVLELGLEEFPYGLTVYGSDRAALLAHVDRELTERADRARESGVICRIQILEGSAPAEIVQRAADIGAGLVVIGTHGRTGLARVLLGNVAERIVRRSKSPVLSIPFTKKAA